MLRFIVKTLIILWPFLKNVVFKDRTVLEVLIKNKHITIMMVMVLLMMLTIVSTVNRLSAVKQHVNKTNDTLVVAKEKIHTLEQQLGAMQSAIAGCVPTPEKKEPYDKKWIIDSISDGSVDYAP